MSLATTSAAPVMFPPAELERRFSSFLIDRAVGWGVAAGVAFAVWRLTGSDGIGTALLGFAGAVVVLGLVAAVVTGMTGMTPGKAAVGLRVVRRSDGRAIGVGPAIGRAVVLGVAGIPTVGLGLATLAWTAAADPTRQRRALHDRIGDAIVVDVRPMPVEVDEVGDRPQQIVNLTAMRLVPVVEPAPVATPTPTAGSTSPEQAAPQLLPHERTHVRGAHAPLPRTTPPPAAAPAPASPVAPAPPVSPAASTRPPTPAAPPAAHRAAPRVATPPVAIPPTAVPSAAAPAASAPPAAVAQPATPAVQWRVTFDSGETFVVEGLALVGRKPEPRAGEPVRHVVPLRSSDMSLSKTHAQFQVAPDGALVVMDRGSTNGSFVVRGGMSKSLTPGRPSTLLAGDLVRFGDRAMRVERD